MKQRRFSIYMSGLCEGQRERRATIRDVAENVRAKTAKWKKTTWKISVAMGIIPQNTL